MAKPETSPWESSYFEKESQRGKEIAENPRSLIPSYSPEPTRNDYLASALMGFKGSMDANLRAAALGDPVLASLAAIAGAAGAPTPGATANQRRAVDLAALENIPVEQIAPGLIEKHPEFRGLPLATVQKLAPLIQRSEAMEQQLAIALARMNADESARKDRAQEKRDTAAALKRLPPDKVLALNEGKNVARLLPEVEQALSKNAAIFGPVEGKARGSNPYDTNAQTVDARMRTAAQAFGRFMEGGVLRKEDEEKYRKMFPQLNDTPELAKNKLAIVQRQLIQKYEDDKATLGRSGYDVGGFESLSAPASVFDAPQGILMVSPSGKTGMVPADRVTAAEKKGFRRAQ